MIHSPSEALKTNRSICNSQTNNFQGSAGNTNPSNTSTFRVLERTTSSTCLQKMAANASSLACTHWQQVDSDPIREKQNKSCWGDSRRDSNCHRMTPQYSPNCQTWSINKKQKMKFLQKHPTKMNFAALVQWNTPDFHFRAKLPFKTCLQVLTGSRENCP